MESRGSAQPVEGSRSCVGEAHWLQLPSVYVVATGQRLIELYESLPGCVSPITEVARTVAVVQLRRSGCVTEQPP